MIQRAHMESVEARFRSVLALGTQAVESSMSTAPYAGWSMDRFVSEALRIKPWAGQARIVRSLSEHPRTSVASSHGAGKSFIAGPAALAYLHTYENSIVVTTAPTSRQVRDVLWRYIRTAARTAKNPLPGRALQVRYEIRDNWYAVGFTGNANNTDSVQGLHAENILVIVDEASGVSEAIMRAIPAILTGANARLLLIGNPTSTSGMFFDSFHGQSHLYNTIQIPAYATPNFTTFGITREDMVSGAWEGKITGPLPMPGMIDPAWVANAMEEHGPDSEYVKSRVDAVFPDNSSDVLITRAMIDNAERSGEEMPEGERWYAGIDVGRGGGDETAVCIRRGHVRVFSDAWRGDDTMETVGRFRAILASHGIPERDIEVRVDVVGLGAGVHDRLREEGFNAVEWIAGARSSDRVKWRSFKDEAYWQHKERYRLGLIAPLVTPRGDGEVNAPGAIDSVTRAQMTDIRYSYRSGYTMPVVESKDEVLKRGARSPDRAEAEIICYSVMPPKEGKAPPPFGALGVAGKARGWSKR